MAARSDEANQDATAGIKSAAAVDISATDASFASITRGLYLGVTGNVVVQFAGDSASVTLTGLAAGIWHALQLQKVIKTGTTATNMVVGY
jgi:hypothetical protein